MDPEQESGLLAADTIRNEKIESSWNQCSVTYRVNLPRMRHIYNVACRNVSADITAATGMPAPKMMFHVDDWVSFPWKERQTTPSA